MGHEARNEGLVSLALLASLAEQGEEHGLVDGPVTLDATRDARVHLGRGVRFGRLGLAMGHCSVC